ncbi:MAG: DegV family protein [Lachnospiraceae bacterium]|nr:DegV family protein [Lachnospiraceae bacterium]
MLRILVDSAADYLPADAALRNIEFIPLTVTMDEISYQDGIDLTPDEYYEKLAKAENFPKTSQPSPQAFADIFQDVKDKGDEMICITLAAALSGTYQSANIAKDLVDYEHIHIINSKTATVSIRFLADLARDLSDQGVPTLEIIEQVKALRSKIKVLAALDTLEYLYKGGRLSKGVATIGEMVNLKPIISLDSEGAIMVPGKCVGKNKATQFILKGLKELKVDSRFPLYTVYTLGTDNCQHLENKITAEGFTVGKRLQVGATIGSHIGPGVFGIIFVQQ